MTALILSLAGVTLAMAVVTVTILLVFRAAGGRLGAKCRYTVWMLVTARLCIEPGNETFIREGDALFTADGKVLVLYFGAGESYTVPQGVEQIDYRAFDGRKELKSVAFPETLRSIGSFAFNDSGIEELSLNASLETIGSYAFGSCVALRKVVLPDNCRYVADGAFAFCTSLKRADLGSLAALGGGTFCGCTALTDITVPSTLSYVGGAEMPGDVLHPFYNTPWYDALSDEFVVVGDGILIKYNGGGTNPSLPENVKSVMRDVLPANVSADKNGAPYVFTPTIRDYTG